MSDLRYLSRVLVVEDEAIILLDIETTLLDAGVADVRTATSTAEAITLIEAMPFDAAVLDLHLGTSGWSYEISHRLRAMGVPLVLSSGTTYVAEGFQEVPLLLKPFAADRLISTLLEVTAARLLVAAQ